MAAAVSPVHAPTAEAHTIEAYARELVGRREPLQGERVLALAADPDYSGPALIHVHGTEVVVRGCVSALAVREALSEVPPGTYLIVLTDRPVTDLGESLVARFRRQRVEPLDPWTTVPGMFAGRHVDSALRSTMPWLPTLLFDWLPPGGYRTSATGVVTRDHIMGCLTEVILEVPAGEVGLGRLLEALGDLEVRKAWDRLDEPAREAIIAWVGERAGPAAAGVLTLSSCPTTSHVQVLALGLMLDVLYTNPAQPDVLEARHTWEHGYRLPRIAPAAAAQIGAAARTRMRQPEGISRTSHAEIWRDTPEAFAIAGFPAGIRYSPNDPRGYLARLDRVCSALARAIPAMGTAAGSRPAPDPTAMAELEDAAAHLAAHDLAQTHEEGDTRRVEMAVRLIRWLASPQESPPADLGAALNRQVRVDGWVDQAVADAWSGSERPDFAAVLNKLCQVVLAARREHDHQFAQLLVEVTGRDVLPPDLLAVEHVLHEVIEPLSRVGLVLMIVIDGMSAAVAAAIGSGISRLAWVEQVPAAEPGRQRAAILAALPTMTRFCRTSLLCGRLREGTQVDEKRGFTEVTGGRLFHKDDLRAAGGSAVNADVAAAIAGQSKVVGVVLNTVDDTLAKHDPDGTRWNVAAIAHLQPLLELARQHGRTVVITSDHGHVVERGGRLESRELAEARWRPAATGRAGPDEVLLSGPRVLAGGGAIVAPWVEDLRYGRKSAGYHGGASAAEVTIPLLVFASSGVDFTTVGWQPAGEPAPSWWESPVVTGAPAPPAATSSGAPAGAKRRRRRTPAAPPESQTLFQASTLQATSQATPSQTTPRPQPEPAAPVSTKPADPHAGPIDAFLSSPTYVRMRADQVRGSVNDEAVRQVLRLLLAAGGRAPAEQVARALGVGTNRLNLALSGLRRLLNVEGYQVISMDPDGRTVVLDEPLWRQQFGLDR